MRLEEFLTHVKGVKKTGSGYIGLCPGHSDKNQSLSVKAGEDRILINCFTGCSPEQVVGAMGLTLSDLFFKSGPPQTPLEESSVTVKALADDKGFTVEELEGYGALNHRYGVIIQYYDHRGKKAARQRLRKKLSAKDGSIWFKGSGSPIIYGSWKLKEMSQAHDYITLVEGESDSWTLWHYNLPALGVPGADMAKRLNSGHVDKFARVFIWKEPDKGGETFVNGLLKKIVDVGYQGDVFIITPPDGVKDPNELHRSLLDKPGEFKSTWERLIASAEKVDMADAHKFTEPTTRGRSGLPEIIITDTPLRDISAQALKALEDGNNPPFLFVRDGHLSKVTRSKGKDRNNDIIYRPVLKQVNESTLRGYMARTADFLKLKSGDHTAPCSPPLDCVKDIMSLDDWPLPLLQGVVQAPIFRQDSSIMSEPGYDPVTSLYYIPDSDFDFPRVPEAPSQLDTQRAVNLLREPLYDFPFDSIASRTNAIAALLTVTLRDLIPGPVPMAVFDKPQQGTGASLLTDSISLVATGQPGHMTTAPTGKGKDEEWRKKITSILLDGLPLVVIDNVEGVFNSPSLAAVLTANYWKDRILGRSENTAAMIHRTCWMVTGNNIRLTGDLPRRCYMIRLDAQCPRPWQRDSKEFKHPELLSWIREARGEILSAIFTLARSWILAGKPLPNNLPKVGSFEDWTRTIGGILHYSGFDGFLENMDMLYEQAEENDGMEAFLEAWFSIWGDIPVTTKEVQRELESNEEFEIVLPDYLDHEGRNFSRKLGWVLKRRAGVHFPNGLYIEKSGDHKRAVKWRVRKKEFPPEKEAVNSCYQGEFW